MRQPCLQTSLTHHLQRDSVNLSKGLHFPSEKWWLVIKCGKQKLRAEIRHTLLAFAGQTCETQLLCSQDHLIDPQNLYHRSWLGILHISWIVNALDRAI